MVEDAKRFFAQPAPLFPDLFAEEKPAEEPKPAASGIDAATDTDDDLPPW